MRHTELVERNWRLSASWINQMSKTPPKFVLCVRNNDCPDLEVRKLYQALPDKHAERDGFLRIVDESGEDYLYPQSYFAAVRLARKAHEAMAACR